MRTVVNIILQYNHGTRYVEDIVASSHPDLLLHHRPGVGPHLTCLAWLWLTTSVHAVWNTALVIRKSSQEEWLQTSAVNMWVHTEYMPLYYFTSVYHEAWRGCRQFVWARVSPSRRSVLL